VKVTKSQLKQIIKEEIEYVINEANQPIHLDPDVGLDEKFIKIVWDAIDHFASDKEVSDAAVGRGMPTALEILKKKSSDSLGLRGTPVSPTTDTADTALKKPTGTTGTTGTNGSAPTPEENNR
tara:strand:+ start:526 stop:894 length:369 start_codon:yes stop_codon:yes gene_type:complete